MSFSSLLRFVFYPVSITVQVRAAAVSALAKFGAECADLRGSIETLLRRCLLDSDDEVRDRATFYLALLAGATPPVVANFILDALQV